MHPRRLADYKPIHIRLDNATESYLNSLRQDKESNSALIRRIADEHKEQNILKRWEGK